MELSKLTLRNYMTHVRQMCERLRNPDEMRRLLDAAREDTRIVDEILREMAIMHATESDADGDYEEAQAAAKRDLLTFLALRAIEQGQESQAGTSSEGSQPALRFRCAEN